MMCALTMVLAYAVGCWIAAVTRGPHRNGDVLPFVHGRPPHDD